jgi:hypothetical protein
MYTVGPLAQAHGGPLVHAEPGGSLVELRRRFTPWQLGLLEKLNRRDSEHLARAECIVVPDVWHDDELVYSPVPAWDAWASEHPKALHVDLSVQAFAAYEHGHLVRWGPISSGRAKSRTPPGLFHLNWRSPGRYSTDDPSWFLPWYFNFENRRGLSFHEYALPGRPASHACVRLLAPDARWLFAWGEEWVLDQHGQIVLDPGTPVRIVGGFDHATPPPWMQACTSRPQ